MGKWRKNIMFQSKNKKTRALAWAITLCMTVMLFPMMTLTAQAADPIIWDGHSLLGGLSSPVNNGDTVVIKDGATGPLYLPPNANVTVIGGGSAIGGQGSLGFDIPPTSTVTWTANFDATNGGVGIGGGGTFNMPGGLITTNGSQGGTALVISGGTTVNISGGTVSYTGGSQNANMIHIYSQFSNPAANSDGGHLIISGTGVVSTNGGTAILLARSVSPLRNDLITVTVNGGTVVTTCEGDVNSHAISIGLHGGVVNINDGMVSSADQTAIHAFNGIINVNGGTVSALGGTNGTAGSLTGTKGAIYALHQTEINISSGTITATGTGGFALYASTSGDVTISGGTLNGWIGGIEKISDISAGTGNVSSAGGDRVITLTGTYLTNGITVTAFDGAMPITTGTTTGSATSQTVMLTFPKNDLENNKIYTIKAALDGSTFSDTPSATVTVSGFGTNPPTGIPGITGYLWAMILFLLISAVLWGTILRRRLNI
jgi:hypothetical protein